MPDVIFPFAIGTTTKTFLDDAPTPTGRLVEAGARSQAGFDALAYALYARELSTGTGDDRLIAEAGAVGGSRAEARGLSIGDATGTGFFGPGRVDLGAGNDGISATAIASTPVGSSGTGVLSVRASALTVDLGSGLSTGSGADKMNLTATATAHGTGESPELVVAASGLENLGTVLLGDGDDSVVGRGTADADGLENLATLAFGITQITGTASNPGDAGVFDTSADTITSDNDTLDGTASATGESDVGAFGVLVTNATTGRGADTIKGVAEATGVGSTDARGITVGLSDIDDDTLQNPDDTNAVLPAQVGTLRTGRGADQLIAEARTVAEAAPGQDLFFANATGITNDGGTLEQLEELLAPFGFDRTDLARAVNGEDVPGLLEAVEAVLPDLDTSTLDTGRGNDVFSVAASLKVAGGLQGGDPSGEGDPDLEVFVEGVENSGTIRMGAGNDTIEATVSGSSVGGAKILVEGIDNSGVGVSTGLNLDDQVNQQTLLDMGAGDDSITVTTRVRGVGDLAAGDGIDTRSNLDMGSGDDTITLSVSSEFVRDTVNPGDQEEGIADGIENRGNVLLGTGNDSITANVQATGNGILSVAEGIETRNFFDAGAGNDRLDLTATAISTRGVLADNLTQAAGLQTEQITSGTVILGDGDDTVRAEGIANSDGLENRATLAFGITQVTGDASNAADAGLIDTSVADPTTEAVTTDNDTLAGKATATGESDVNAFGVLLTNASTGIGIDTVTGTAVADGKDFAQASGVAIGVSNNVPGQTSLLPDEAGTLRTGDGGDSITGRAHATTASGTEALFNDADAVLVDLGSVLDTGSGADVIAGKALAVDVGLGGGAFSAVVADGIENRGTMRTGAGDDVVEGYGETRSNQAFSVAGGIDNGLGSTQNGIPVTPLLDTGDGLDRLTGSSVSSAVGADAFAGGIENFGTIRTGSDGDRLMARADSTVTLGEAGDLANADGIDNRFRIETGSGDDRLDATVTARAEGGDADAIGIRNDLGGEADNVIDLGSGSDQMIGVAEATATDGNATAVGISGGTVTTDSGASPQAGTLETSDDLISGTATAAGTEEAGAFGVRVTNTSTGAGSDVVTGAAKASSASSAEAIGIAVGASGNAGLLDTGAQADELIGRATAEGKGARAIGVSVADGSEIRTGNGADSIVGTASVTAAGKAQLAGIHVSNEGPAAGGLIQTGNGRDCLNGEVLLAEDVIVDWAAGILIDPGAEIRTGNGADFVSGSAGGLGAEAAFGIAGGGALRTGDGNDEIFASSFGGGVQVFAGTGDDVVTGFGNARLNGGENRNGMDVDTLVIDFDFFDAGGKVVQMGNQTNFILGDETMVTVNFEQFNINGVMFPPDELPIV